MNLPELIEKLLAEKNEYWLSNQLQVRDAISTIALEVETLLELRNEVRALRARVESLERDRRH